MRIMGTSFFLGIMATIILGITLLSIAIYDIACHRIRHVIKYLFFILMGIAVYSDRWDESFISLKRNRY